MELCCKVHVSIWGRLFYMRKSFVFYLSWRELIDSLTDEELRRFMNNLISWHQNEEIELTSKSESAIWSLIEPALVVNENKWNSRAGASRENGKLGGRPPKPKITQQVFEEPTKPVNNKELIDNRKKINENSEMLIEETKEINDNTGISQAEYYRKRIFELESKLVQEYPQYTFLNKMANPNGIKELKHHIENKNELDSITLILKELAQSKKYLTGKYE